MDVQTAATIESLRQQLEAARAYIDGNDVRSDFRTVTEMRAALEAARRDNDFLRGFINNPDVEALRQQLAAARQALNDTDMELARAMRRAEVLAAEVRIFRQGMDDHDNGPFIVFADGVDDVDAVAFGQALDMARDHTDRTQALDAGKFEVKP